MGTACTSTCAITHYLALLQLIILPKIKTIEAAQNLLKSSKSQPEFRQQLDLVEAMILPTPRI